MSETRGRKRKSIAEQKRNQKVYQPERNGHPAPKITDPPRMPTGLTPQAKRLWKRYVPLMTEKGMATQLDELELEALVRYADCFLESSKCGDRKGMTEAYAQMKTITKRFGMAPLDRQRLRECGQEVKKSEIETFLSGGMGVVNDTA